jgi:hypothetical protein
MVLRLASLVLLSNVLCGFALFSGPEEATLPVDPTQPQIIFRLSPDMPSIKNKDEFLDGAYQDLSDEEFWLTLVTEAMARWNDVNGSFVQMTAELDDSATIDPEDHLFSIVTNNVSVTVAASASPQVEEGKIVDCDIQVGDRSAEADSLAYTLMHEVGHCLGLGHNHSDYDAVMGYTRLSKNLSLGADDKAGVIYLYPEDGDTPKELISCGTIGTKVSSWPLLALIFLPCLVLLLKLAIRPSRYAVDSGVTDPGHLAASVESRRYPRT